MQKILITGANGFFGTRFISNYKAKYHILSTDVHNLDIKNADNVNEVFESFKPDYVIHAAAVANTDFCNKNPEIAHAINIDGAINVARACEKSGSKLVFISSEQVFNGNKAGAPFDESSKPVPDTMYGITKLEAEGKLREITDKLWILRFTWLFGVPERKCGMASNILWDTITGVIKCQKMKVTCNEYRGLTYVHDLVDQFDKLFELPFDLYHTGSHNDLSRYEIVCHIMKELGIGSRIEELIEKDEIKYAEHPRDVRLCTDKLKSCGFEFSDSSASISKCIAEFKLKLI